MFYYHCKVCSEALYLLIILYFLEKHSQALDTNFMSNLNNFLKQRPKFRSSSLKIIKSRPLGQFFRSVMYYWHLLKPLNHQHLTPISILVDFQSKNTFPCIQWCTNHQKSNKPNYFSSMYKEKWQKDIHIFFFRGKFFLVQTINFQCFDMFFHMHLNFRFSLQQF